MGGSRGGCWGAWGRGVGGSGGGCWGGLGERSGKPCMQSMFVSVLGLRHRQDPLVTRDTIFLSQNFNLLFVYIYISLSKTYFLNEYVPKRVPVFYTSNILVI